MSKINEEEKNKIKDIFSEKLKDEVNILFFDDGEEECQYCGDTQEILEEITGLDDRINFSTHTLGDETADKYNIDKAPATLFVDDEGEDMGVYFYGIPSGYEFNTLIEDIVDVSAGSIDLPEEVIKAAGEIDEDVLLEVFVTPTCPYCPRSVRVAHHLAMVNPRIKGVMVEAIEFQELSNRYNVSGVPKTVINEGAAEQVGAVPADTILEKIKEVI